MPGIPMPPIPPIPPCRPCLRRGREPGPRAWTGWPPEARILLGWNVFTLSVMAQLWPLMMRAGPARTRELATREDDSRALAGTITMTAALVSLIGVVFLLSDAHDSRGTRELLLTALAVGTVATSWLLVQTEYTLHYARRYYRDGRGVLFPHGDGNLEEPTYWDFAYLSVTTGMTYQVSDTNLNTRAMRRLQAASGDSQTCGAMTLRNRARGSQDPLP